MNALMLALLFFCGSMMIVSEATAQDDAYDGGPTKREECVTPPKADFHFDAGFYRVVGNTVYEVDMWTDCHVKIFDLPFAVQGFDQVGWSREEGFLFWSDGTAYRCDATGESFERIDAAGLLTRFLHHPIEWVSATDGYSGCGGGGVDNVDHEIVEVDAAVPSLLHEVRPAEERPEKIRRVNGIDLEDLTWALRSVDIDPWRPPSAVEFAFDAGDLRAYTERVTADIKRLREGSVSDFVDYPAPTSDDYDIFTVLPTILDTLSPEIVRAALVAHRTEWRSTSSYSYRVTLVNAVGDTLICTFASDGPTQPFALPWTLRYGDAELQSYNVELARLLMKLLPEKEYRTEREHKVDMLYVIAEYLGEVRSRRE